MELTASLCYSKADGSHAVSLLKRQPAKFANLMLAACLLLACFLVSDPAFAHMGHHGAQPEMSTPVAQPQPTLGVEHAACQIGEKPAHILFEASVTATECGPGLCANSCCHSGANCCATSCLAADAQLVASAPNRMTNLPRVRGGSDGIEPGGLTEPPNRRA